MVQDWFLPWYDMLNNGSDPYPYIMGSTSLSLMQTATQ